MFNRPKHGGYRRLWDQNKHTCQEGTECSHDYLNHDCCRQNENDIPMKGDTVAENWAKNYKGHTIGYTLCKLHAWKWPVVKDKHIKMKPRNIYILFVFDLDGECKFIKNKTLQLCSWLPPFCIQNLLFIQPRWQPRTYLFNNLDVCKGGFAVCGPSSNYCGQLDTCLRLFVNY